MSPHPLTDVIKSFTKDRNTLSSCLIGWKKHCHRVSYNVGSRQKRWFKHKYKRGPTRPTFKMLRCCGLVERNQQILSHKVKGSLLQCSSKKKKHLSTFLTLDQGEVNGFSKKKFPECFSTLYTTHSGQQKQNSLFYRIHLHCFERKPEQNQAYTKVIHVQPFRIYVIFYTKCIHYFLSPLFLFHFLFQLVMRYLPELEGCQEVWKPCPLDSTHQGIKRPLTDFFLLTLSATLSLTLAMFQEYMNTCNWD